MQKMAREDERRASCSYELGLVPMPTATPVILRRFARPMTAGNDPSRTVADRHINERDDGSYHRRNRDRRAFHRVAMQILLAMAGSRITKRNLTQCCRTNGPAEPRTYRLDQCRPGNNPTDEWNAGREILQMACTRDRLISVMQSSWISSA